MLHREEFVIIGFTRGSRSAIGGLPLGYYAEDGTLHYAGRVGSGFDERERKHLFALLEPLVVAKMPVVQRPRPSRFDSGQPLRLAHVQWVRPKLVAHVRYLNWTADGLPRHTVYLGLREDKPACEVIRREAIAEQLDG